MYKAKMIKNIYKVLLLYEDVQNPGTLVSETDYLSYLNRMYVLFSKNNEITQYLNGLIRLGMEATHSNVRAAVFYMIKIIDKGAI
mgnify:FL=1